MYTSIVALFFLKMNDIYWSLWCYVWRSLYRLGLHFKKNFGSIKSCHYKGVSACKSSMNPPKVKRRVGKYEVGRTIGEGTFAKVKFARNSETGEPVALKILDKEKVLKHKMAEQVSLGLLFPLNSWSFSFVYSIYFLFICIMFVS